jgi:4-methylaminobutanoate oxidase (formaldehyde-forming)
MPQSPSLPIPQFPSQARVVIIGGGIAGVSIAYHLAKMGERDIVLLDKGELTSGSTWHAAGMVTHFHTSPTIMRMRKYSIDLYRGIDDGAGFWHEVGSLRVASSPDQFLFLKRQVGMAKAIGLNCEIISPRECLEIFPWMTDKDLYGGMYLPTDGWIDPGGGTMEIARRAKLNGAQFFTGVRVNAIQRAASGKISAVVTQQGAIQTECVVNAGGMWGRQLGEMVGVNLPMTPLGHQHLLARVPNFTFPKTMPCLRDPENLVYLREEVGGLVIGGFELEPRAWALDGVPWDFTQKLLPPDWDLFAPIMDGAIRRMPMLEHADAVHLVHGPEALTPDSKPLLGPIPDVFGFWAACGLSHTGFGAGAAIGEIIAEWIVHGEPPYDVTELNVRRFGEIYRDRNYASERAREAYKYYYWLRFPHDENERAREKRKSPLDAKLLELGAVFGEKNGWERVDYFERDWRLETRDSNLQSPVSSLGSRAGADQRATGWFDTPFFEQVGAEHRAARERVALWDMTSFGKLDVRGADALKFLNSLADNDLNKPVGSLVYTQFLNPRGGIESDVTIARLGQEHFRVICGSNFVASDLGWMRMQWETGDWRLEINDVTEQFAVLGLWGPHARQVLERVTRAEVSNAAFPYMTGQYIEIENARVWAQRVTYVGELGWEMYMQNADAARVWDALMQTGRDFEIRPAGYKAIDSLRLEKGYRYWSTDMTPNETPYEAGLGFCVKLSKGDFIGRDALLHQKTQGITRKLVTITLEKNMGLYGGEPVYHNNKLLGRLRSGGYGYTVGKSIGLVYVPTELAQRDTPLEIEIFGERFPAHVDADVLYDPKGEKIRA